MQQHHTHTLWLLHWSASHFQLASLSPGAGEMHVQHTARYNTITEGIEELNRCLQNEAAHQTIHVSVTDAHAITLPYVWRAAAESTYRYSAPITEHYLEDNIPTWQVMQAFAAPLVVHNRLSEKFTTVQYHSALALALNTYNGFSGTTQVQLIAGPQHCSFIVKKEAQLQLCQTYVYTAPLDVVYYLLKVKETVALPDDILVVLCGEAVTSQRLTENIHQYFPNAQPAVPPQRTVTGFEGAASQLFHLLNLAACVS